MPEKEYYAHITPDGRKQTVIEHLRGTAERAASCLVDVGLGKSAYLAGLLHDMGKFTAAFQSYLKVENETKRGSVIHTFQGCRFLLEKISGTTGQDPLVRSYTAELLAFAVGAHHGLFDCFDETGKSGMQYRKEKEEKTFFQEAVAGFYAQEISSAEITDYIDQSFVEIDRFYSKIERTYDKDDEFCFEVGLLARLLLSAVIEGDRHDTVTFINNTNPTMPIKGGDRRLIWRNVLQFMEKKLELLPKDTPVAKARTAISNQCKNFADRPKGVYRLNVPTGGGKTLSALRYALAHAEKYGHKRLIFTSPLLSILEQNAAVIHEYVGDDSLILEHHSAVIEAEQTKEQLDERELLIQSWDAPIIITTLVQLLNSMFDGKTSSIRRFQALCDSVIVIDEVQTVPTKLLSLFNLTIRFLTEQCGATVVLCSATQPYLEGAQHPLFPPPENIVPYDPIIWNAFIRTRLEPSGELRLEELPDFIRTLMEDVDSLLVVCNKRSEAEFLFSKTKSDCYVSYHLSASMCMQHRRDVVAKLQTSLGRKEKTLCISTQVIEAGVDISFQRALRLTAGMDSIVQTAGRCNRNGESICPCPVYIVNCSDERLGKLPDIQRGKTATIDLFNAFHCSQDRFYHDLASDSAIEYYYKAFYNDMNKKAQDYPLAREKTTFLDLASENSTFIVRGGGEVENWALRQAFKTAGHAFAVFEENTTNVLVPYGTGKELILQMGAAQSNSDLVYCEPLLKQATSYSVSLYEYQLKKLEAEGALYPICERNEGVFRDALALQSDFYDDQIGLTMDGEGLPFLEVRN